jgi:hypothetical protein
VTAVTVEELVKAYRELRTKERQRTGHSNLKSYANAGIEKSALNRSAEATTRFMRALMPLQKEIMALSEGEKLLEALTAESDARDQAKSARGAEDGSWERTQVSVRRELIWQRREIKELVHSINSQLGKPKTETQKAIEEALEIMAEAAKNVFGEAPALLPLYLGGGAHEGHEHSWNVYAYRDNEYVGTIRVVWPGEPGGRMEYEGVLFSEIGPTFRVTDLVIAVVLLHLGMEFGRRSRRKAARERA